MTTFDLVTLDVDQSADSSTLRRLGRRAARLLGLPDVDATRVSTSVSEIGRLAQRRGPVRLSMRVLAAAHDATTVTAPLLSIALEFDGAGSVLEIGSAVHTAAARLMDEVAIATDRITIAKQLPRPIASPDLVTIRDELLRESSADPNGPLQSLNDELVTTLLALRERETELVALNAELDQTNRGVVALYAELEQRTDEVRNAQRAVFEELGAALRPPAPVVPGVELGVRYVPTQVNSPTGGDLYDWFVLPDGTLHITVVDVRGHGVAATRDALQVTHAVRTLSLEGHELGQLLGRADAIFRSAGAPVVATALVARLDLAGGALSIAGAGHPPALRVPAGDGAPTYVAAPGRPLGYDNAGSDHVAVVTLEPDECVLFYTDGLVEIRHDLIEGMDTLAETAGRARRMRLPQLLDATLSNCSRGDPLRDDTLLLAARWNSPSAP